jgi:hypothetical protein
LAGTLADHFVVADEDGADQGWDDTSATALRELQRLRG